MWLAILNLIGGPVVGGLLKAYSARLAAQGNIDQRTVDLAAKQLTVDQREAELNAQVLVAEQGNWLTRCIRPLFALPFVIYVWKLLLWDKVLGGWTHGATDALSPWLASMATVILTAYFGGRSLEKIAAILKR